ncbi:MAG: hypothetical protein GY765_25245 [bacterium]|nr:hypothetical protein [bacterium]
MITVLIFGLFILSVLAAPLQAGLVDVYKRGEIKFSSDGEFVCETRMDKGTYDFDIDRRFKNLTFTNHGIFGLFQLKGSEDTTLRIG